MRIGRLLVRPFSERISRMLTMGYWSTLEDLPYDDWPISARRFGLSPRTLEAFVTERYPSRK